MKNLKENLMVLAAILKASFEARFRIWDLKGLYYCSELKGEP
jgi:hypothetical protein